MKRRLPLLPLVVGWFALVVAGMFVLMLESFEPGEPAVAPSRWPADTALPRSGDRPTLVLVAHPHCSCTRATLGELAELVPRIRDRIDTIVLFTIPDGDEQAARAGELWQQAAAIDGVRLVADADGSEAARFGAETSGQAYLYRPDGALAFAGGLTPARGERGDSLGRRAILALASGDPVAHEDGNVFGCALDDAAVQRFWLPALRPAAAVGGEGARP